MCLSRNAQVAIRNIRRDVDQEIKKLAKDKTLSISEDQEADVLEEVQKLTNSYIGYVEGTTAAKEKDLMQI